MKVLLADPPQRERKYDLSYPNLGILYLMSYLKHAFGSAIEVRYLEGHCNLQEHIQAIKDFQPEIYGLSFAFWTRELSYSTLNEVKKHFPDMLVVCGGALPTSDYADVLTNTIADICVVGEGEETLKDLVVNFESLESVISDIRGIAFKNNNGEIIITPKRALIPDIDKIPFPAWEEVDLSKYNGMHINKKRPQMHMLVSRGCPFDCNFCSNPVWKNNKPWIRMRSASNIADEVNILYRLGIREIYMTSDEFNVSEEWSIEVCKAIEKLGYRDISFQCNIRADRVSERLIEAFKAIDMWMVHLGIESGNQKTLDGIAKHVTIEQIENACTLFAKHKIAVFGFVMLFHAWEQDDKLFYESKEDVDKTFLFCKKMLSSGLLKYMSWQVATPMPGSRLWKTANKFNLIPNHVITSVWTQNLCLPNITEKDIRRAIRKGFLIKSYYAFKNGNINYKHFDRIYNSIKVLIGLEKGRG